MIEQEQKTLYYNLYKNDTVKKTNLFTNVIVCNVSVCDFCREGSGLEMTGVLLLCLTQSKSPRPDRLSSTWRMSWTLRCRLSTERSEIELYIMIIRQYFVCLCAGFFRPVIDSWLTKCSYSFPWRVNNCHLKLISQDILFSDFIRSMHHHFMLNCYI